MDEVISSRKFRFVKVGDRRTKEKKGIIELKENLRARKIDISRSLEEKEEKQNGP